MNLSELKARWKGWREKRFLENYDCKTWREYELKYDPDYNAQHYLVSQVYHGYSSVWAVPSSYYKSSPRRSLLRPSASNNFQFDEIDDMVEWCEQHCQGKWRNEWHRVRQDHNGDYFVNIAAGADIMFFAFKEESDYTWFTLRWS